MSYFLKQSKLNGKTYLQIYESIYDPSLKRGKNKCYQKIGYLENLISEKIPDPISFYKEEVAKLNTKEKKEKEEAKIKLIEEDPVKNFGYFLVKVLYNTLNLEKEMEPMKHIHKFKFNISELIEALTYSRIVNPCSKLKTYSEVIPQLYGKYDFSLDQIYDGLEFIGSSYSDFIEILNHCLGEKIKRQTNISYFDCTNYYFEIDFEFEDKKKGPSKENRKSPIIGQALLLDGDSIPLGMKMYPGNESEKPKLRELIQEMKTTQNITGRTIQVADKGLNCGDNIYEALKNKDGYIFSQSVAMLDEKEKNWVLQETDYVPIKDKYGEVLYYTKSCEDVFEIKYTDKNGKKKPVQVKQKRIAIYNPSLAEKKKREIEALEIKAKSLCYSKAKKDEYGESGKYVNFVNEDGTKATAKINMVKIEEDKRIAGYNMLITSETKTTDESIYRVYHNLWKIENIFRILKSQLDARPVYLQTKEKIYGHFLICYYAVTLLRVLEEKVFKKAFSTYELIEMIRKMRIVADEKKNINITPRTKIITELVNMTKLKFNHFYLTDKELEKMFKMVYTGLKK